MSPASIEWLCPHCGVIRAGPEHHSWESKDPYEWSCTVVVQGDKLELKGVCRNPTLQQARDTIQAIKEAGYKGYTRERIRR